MSRAKVPVYRRQRHSPGKNTPKDRALVLLEGKRVYLGPYGSGESKKRCADLVADKRKPAALESAGGPVTVNRLLLSFLRYAKTCYRDRDGNLIRVLT